MQVIKMKTAIFFDVDGTMFDNEHQCIHPSTRYLIETLAKDDRYVLGLATGRSLEQLDAIKDIRDYFKVKIVINGAVSYIDNDFVYGRPIDVKDCEAVLKYANSIHTGIGFIGKDRHCVTMNNETVREALRDFSMAMPEVNPTFYLEEPVYQIWVFSDNRALIDKFKQKFSHLRIFNWHKDGADIVHPEVSKGDAITHLKPLLGVDQVIAFGDGENDVEMIQTANIGVAMGNTRSEALKKGATLIAPRIDEDGLFQAAKQLNLL